MYSSSSSSSQQSAPPNHNNNNTTTPHHLMRYGSAPSSFLSNVAESVSSLDHNHQYQHQNHQQLYTGHIGDSLSINLTESTNPRTESRNTLPLLHDSYGISNNCPATTMDPTTTTSTLIRHSSSPAGFLDHLNSELGYSGTKEMDKYSNQQKPSRLSSQLSFTKQDHHHHSLSQIAELNECMSTHDHNKRSSSASRSTSGFSLSSWDDSNNGFSFPGASSKRAKIINDDILNGLASLDSQHEIAFEMASMEGVMQIPEDSVPCKIRAKRGFATHPRSIAERERRTRISGKLKKLQELVPNMDKQTSYADMLDLAVQHIKGLQSQIQKLNCDLDRCTCGCKRNMES